jgi:hypothetical protein
VPEHPVVVRLREEYPERARRMDKIDHYSLHIPVPLFTHYLAVIRAE